MSKSALQVVRTESAPPTVLDTQRREYLTEDEVERILRHAANERDRLMILMAYRHGLRVSELINTTSTPAGSRSGAPRAARMVSIRSAAARSAACASCAGSNRSMPATCS